MNMPKLPDSVLTTVDLDPAETLEWKQALEGLVAAAGLQRASFVLDAVLAHARTLGVESEATQLLASPYVNTIAPSAEPVFPGNLTIEERLSSIMRWNALAMVVHANRVSGELGGHIASYASGADLFEVGFNHFFRGRAAEQLGDIVFLQPHSAPGVYARAFVEGRLSADDLAHYRQEIAARAKGLHPLPSYPHPWLAPDFWQFPTGSMGIGPINSIYSARFMRYLRDRKLLDTSGRRVWGFFGDGEMDEPESMAALTLAAREGLDNLTWIINCNLQRLDGPVRGNGRIIDELEGLFKGAGWRVIKLVWGSDWDALFARDKTGALVDAFSRIVDGQLQTFAANDGAFNREKFFGQTPALAALAASMTDDEIDRLKRGGHDIRKIYAAFHAAAQTVGQPCVVLAQTKKGYGMGEAGQGKMTTHQQKKLDDDAVKAFRTRFNLPLSDAQCEALQFYRPAEDSAEMRYLRAQRTRLGGALPQRTALCPRVTVPALESYGGFALKADGKEMSSTMALVRMMGTLIKDAELGPRMVPIVADEARTFGMQAMFRQAGIYSPKGQQYEPEDIGTVMFYREATDGQILEEGITEAGALASWTAAATSYATHGLAMLPIYIYYSVFGFQRVGDQIWAAADQRARGILVGATSGRTTLAGEGLQHQDGTSHLVAATIPNCRAYDPATAAELAVILDDAMRSILEQQRDEFFYLTVTNENLPQPDLPDGAADGVLRGMYCTAGAADAHARLLGSGATLALVREAADLLARHFDVCAAVYSVTSWSLLARDWILQERARRLGQPSAPSWVEQQLAGSVPVIAAADYVRAVPESIRGAIRAPYVTLGCDGFGRSDTRARLRDFFEIDARWIAYSALYALDWPGAKLADAARVLDLDLSRPAPWTV
ncbi:alpha-ketoglutarate dehydrogenase [beta proteobacterium AAP99]|nr:alpha-ketoglutarate dehydrogenase [beta proteobacterium AAP99]